MAPGVRVQRESKREREREIERERERERRLACACSDACALPMLAIFPAPGCSPPSLRLPPDTLSHRPRPALKRKGKGRFLPFERARVQRERERGGWEVVWAREGNIYIMSIINIQYIYIYIYI